MPSNPMSMNDFRIARSTAFSSAYCLATSGSVLVRELMILRIMSHAEFCAIPSNNWLSRLCFLISSFVFHSSRSIGRFEYIGFLMFRNTG